MVSLISLDMLRFSPLSGSRPRLFHPMNSSFVHQSDQADRRLTSTFCGPVGYGKMLNHFKMRAAMNTLSHDHLADLTEARISLTPADAERLIGILRKLAKGRELGRTALVVSRDSDFGICRMWSVLAADLYATQPFRSKESALEWLGWIEESVKVES